MPMIFAANSSGVLIDNELVDGLRGIEYQVTREQSDVFALGSPERIAVYYGASRAQGRLRVASANAKLDDLIASGGSFQVVANLKHGQSARSVAFDECYMVGKDFGLESGRHGETIYNFSATRVREEPGGGGTPAA